MKALSISLLSILFFIAATAHAASPLVMDIDGDPLKPLYVYYIRPFMWPRGDGVAIWYNTTCPHRVILAEFRPDFALFNRKHFDVDGILESTDIYIRFPGRTVCPYHSNLWRVSEDPSRGQFPITTGGRIGDFLSEFRIVAVAPQSFAYKFVKCFTSQLCRSVGTVFLEGHRCLVINNNATDSPLTVTFSKAYLAKSSPSATQMAK